MQLDLVVIMEIVWLLSIGGIEYCGTNKIKKITGKRPKIHYIKELLML